MNDPASQRVVYAGKITDATGSRNLVVTWQAPGLVKIVDASSGRVLIFDGVGPWSDTGSFAASETSLIESLAQDLPESLVATLSAGSSGSLIGLRVRPPAGRVEGTSDVYNILSNHPLDAARGMAQTKFVYLDSVTQLPRAVRQVRPNSTVLIETTFPSWQKSGPHNVPSQIVRVEGGLTVYTFNISSVTFQTIAQDNAFQHP
jgi:hypothetical protein